MNELWPALDLNGWKDTYAALHLRTQMIVKVRIALSPMESECRRTALYIAARGLATPPVLYDGRTFELELGLVAHDLKLRIYDGLVRAIPLRPQAIGEFYREFTDMMHEEGIRPHIWPMPQ